jgi:hypothetical protein
MNLTSTLLHKKNGGGRDQERDNDEVREQLSNWRQLSN